MMRSEEVRKKWEGVGKEEIVRRCRGGGEEEDGHRGVRG